MIARAWVRAFAVTLALLGASSDVRAAPTPADVPAAWHAEDAPALALPPLPRDFVRSRGGPIVWIYPREEAARIAALEEVFQEHWARIADELGRDLDPAMTIGIARDLDEMRAIAPVGHPPPRYAVGVAYPAAGIVLLSLDGPGLGSPPDVETVLVHELSHVALQRAVNGYPVPRWFTEGLAILQAGEQTLARAQTLYGTYVDGDLPRVADLDGRFSGRAFEVDVAYAASADVVGYLARVENGGRKLRRLVAGLRRGEPFERALVQSHYVTLETLDHEWRADLRKRCGSLPFVIGGSALWCVATVLLVLAWRKRRVEKRAKLRRLEQEEIALERLEALLSAKLDEGSAAGAVVDTEADDGEDRPSPSDLPPPVRDEDVPTVVHRGRNHTLH